MADTGWRRNKYGGWFNINEVMNKKIRQDAGIDVENQAIHYGNLGKGRDTYYFAIASSNRSTGHFGTGTYFLSNEASENAENSPFFTRGDREKHIVDFSEYNLYRPKYGISTEAERLHDGLKDINYNNYNNNWRFDMFKNDLKNNGISEDKINNALKVVERTRQEYLQKGYDTNYEANIDSLSTVFMKELGYNGIDVRNIDIYDSTGYGSVIYDLNKKKK